MDAKQLYEKWCDAKFGKIPDNVIRPGDNLYSLRMDSAGAYGMIGQTIKTTICSRCGRIGGKNASAFGIVVAKISRIGNECDECGVSLDALDALRAKG